MASPIAHALTGLTIGRLSAPAGAGRRWSWYLFCAVAAIGPDWDLIGGLAFGQVNLFHRGGSHSITAALVFGVIAALALRSLGGDFRRLFVACTALYGSHLVIDFFCGMPGGAIGQPLLWPFSTVDFAAPQPLLPGILHGGPDDSLRDSVALLFTWHNVKALGVEAAVFTPPTMLVWCLTRQGVRDSLA